jgi:hypothetical protein
VFPHMVFMFFYDFFQNYFFLFYFFNIELVENYNCSFPHKTLWIAIVFLYMGLFSFSFSFFLFSYMIFFQNYLCCFYFFNIKLIENLALYFKKTNIVACYSYSPPGFFCYDFFKIIFVNFFFNIELVENYNCIFPHKTL